LNPNIGGNPPRSYAALNGSLTRIFHENFREVISIPCGVLIIDGDRRRLKTDQSFAGIIGRDVKMQELFETIRDVSEIDVSALIQGKSPFAQTLLFKPLKQKFVKLGLFNDRKCYAKNSIYSCSRTMAEAAIRIRLLSTQEPTPRTGGIPTVSQTSCNPGPARIAASGAVNPALASAI